MLSFQDISCSNGSFEGYPHEKKKKWSPNFINSCIKSFVNNLYTPKVIVQNVPKTNVFVTLLFSESTSCQIWKKSFKNHLVINWDLLIKKSS